MFRQQLTQRTGGSASWATRLSFVCLGIGLALIFPLAATPRAQARQEADGALATKARKQKHPLKPAPAGYVPRKEACLRIPSPEMGYTYWVEATYDTYATDRPPSTIRFVREANGERKSELAYPGDGSVLNMVSLEGGSVVAIVFELASALEVKAFRLEKDRVTPIFERGSKFPPEFAEGTILVHTGWVPIGERCCTAEKTELWAWTGKNYKLASTVPYGKGYEALAKLPPSAWFSDGKGSQVEGATGTK